MIISYSCLPYCWSKFQRLKAKTPQPLRPKVYWHSNIHCRRQSHIKFDLQSQPLSNMTARYNGGSANSNLYLSSVDISGCEGDSASSESSACSPLNLYVRPPEPLEISVEHQCLEQGYENIYREGTDEFMKYSYPVLVQDPVSAAAIGMIPVELDIEGCYETQDRQQKKNENERVVPLHVLSVCNRYRPYIDDGC